MTNLQYYLNVFYKLKLPLTLIILAIVGLGIYEAIEMKWTKRYEK